jgi:ElaB/YqjD/DUF883 family membrane-anchored ribosome-binding protein
MPDKERKMEATKAIATTDVSENGRTEKLREVVHEKIESAKVMAGKVNEKAHEALEKVADTSLKEVNESVNTYVRDNPGKSILMAAGVGVVIGALLFGRRG